MRIHVVQQGDSIWRIAQIYGSSINQIILVNQLDNPNRLVIGQALVIPETSREYVVQPGDSLWSIAQSYGVSINELVEINNIANPSLIYIGKLLELPYFPHIIQSGETLWSIAQSYGITVSEIVRANNISDPSLLYSGDTLRIPAPLQPVTEVNAYISQVGEQGRQEVLALGGDLTYLSPFTYSMRADGSITELEELPVLEAADANNIAPLLVLTNFSQGEFSSDLAATILRSTELKESLITNLLQTVNRKGYAGINIDLEYVYPEDRENYNDFLRRIVDRFHPEGLIVSTALAPKDSGDQSGLLYEAHDYQAHGEIVDFVVLMTYEWGYAGGEPWAIAPINEVREVLDYAVTVIPRDKIIMGIPLYAREWEVPWIEGTTARTFSPKDAVQLAAEHGVDIQYDEQYQSPFFTYIDDNGQRHEVWFEDARSVQVKFDTIKNYGLRGAGYWALGIPFPQNWAILQNNFRIRKL
ncbi:LysM peptidoglycan-binding domain-containing protein [Halobacillus seohaensis]|uniref:LysM peptidoglycan-binding domain-containing protein n=1 Tax=Halobacillus seohaensis TaxID=447421 RepID=A0ABW2EMN3_9BACI